MVRTRRIYGERELTAMYFELLSRGHRKRTYWDLVAANDRRRFNGLISLVEELRQDKAFEDAYLRRIGHGH